MPGAISNSSTLIHLSRLGRLDLLRDFFEEVLIPPEVWNEVVEQGRGRMAARSVEEAARSGWLKVVAPANDALVRLLNLQLDSGESEAIALALERQGLLLLDESDARRMADIYKLPKTGVIGILMRAKHECKLASLREELDRLRQETGFWISEDIYRKAIHAMGETLEDA